MASPRRDRMRRIADRGRPAGFLESRRWSGVLAYGFDRAMIAGLVHEGLATARRETVTAAHRTTIEVVRITITDAGRRALEG
jgi:hypothetical protein